MPNGCVDDNSSFFPMKPASICTDSLPCLLDPLRGHRQLPRQYIAGARREGEQAMTTTLLASSPNATNSEAAKSASFESARCTPWPREAGSSEFDGQSGRHSRVHGSRHRAEDLLRQTLEIQRRVLGPDHPETARTVLSCFGARQGRRDEALLLLSEAIDHLPPRTLAKVETDPDLSSLHGDSRFDALVARAGQQTITTRKPN
jgi:hypothetical protein